MINAVAVAGPTASGKTALAIHLAKRFGGEIVCADSMQIYKNLDIATAKPTPDELSQAKHWLVDFLDPGEEFSVADYVRLAHEAVFDISSRGKLPVICGGTGLYIDSLLQNISFSEEEYDPEIRRELSEIAKEKGGRYLLEELRKIDPEAASKLHENNVKRIIRAIEVYKISGVTFTEQNRMSRKNQSPYRYLKLVIIFKDREILYQRIDKRVDEMLKIGLLEETGRVLNDETLKTASQAIGYKELQPYFSGEKELSECVENLKRSTRRYAKRQITWFKRDPEAVPIYADSGDIFAQAEELVEKFLKGE